MFTLRKRTGRQSPDARFDLFEDVYVGLFDYAGNVRFFDVCQQPRRNQPPPASDTVTFDELLDRIDRAVEYRSTGITRDERFAEDDPDWSPPAGLPPGVESEKPLTIDDTINEALEEEIDELDQLD